MKVKLLEDYVSPTGEKYPAGSEVNLPKEYEYMIQQGLVKDKLKGKTEPIADAYSRNEAQATGAKTNGDDEVKHG